MERLFARSLLSCPHGRLTPATMLGADADLTGAAFSQLAAGGVHAMPVSAGGQVVGVLDLADFARLAVRIFTRAQDAPHLTARECMGLAGGGRFVVLSMHAPLMDALRSLGEREHRVCIARDAQDASSVFAVLSQIDVVKYVVQHADELPARWAKLTVDELRGPKYLGYAKRDLITVDAADSMLYALQLMDRYGVTGLPVLKKGLLCGTVSLSDVPHALDHLLKSVGEFLDTGKGRGAPLARDVAVVSPTTTFHELLQGFASSGLHRFWVSSGDGKPLGVVSLTDVMRSLLAFARRDAKKKR